MCVRVCVSLLHKLALVVHTQRVRERKEERERVWHARSANKDNN